MSANSPASEVVLSTNIPGLKPFITGKVRDVYDLGDQLLIVTTDRISAFDSVLPTGIPSKGAVLNQLSAFWFERNREFCPSHLISIDDEEILAAVRSSAPDAPAGQLHGRSMLVRKTQALPVECVVRGYLDGSGWKSYQKSRSVCGIELPDGLQQGSQLPEPIFTPSTKATEGHDINISVDEMKKLVPEDVAQAAITMSLEVYKRSAAFARERGIIIADTKFEFGVLNGQVVMIDECLTPDSSRFWDAERWQPGGPQPSFDKQFVRDYLDSVGWDHEPPAPALPADIAEKTAERYRELFRKITGAGLR